MRTSVMHDFDIPAKDVYGFKVLLNGKDISSDCVEADTDLGYAICYIRDEKGQPILDEVEREMFYPSEGKAKVEMTWRFRLRLLTGNVQVFHRDGRELN